MNEIEIQRQILDYLTLKHIFHMRVNTGGLMRNGVWCPSPNTTKGASDILAIKSLKYCRPKNGDVSKAIMLGEVDNFTMGQFVAIEVKRPNGKLSKDQKRFLDEVEKAGGMAIVAYSLDDVRKVF